MAHRLPEAGGHVSNAETLSFKAQGLPFVPTSVIEAVWICAPCLGWHTRSCPGQRPNFSQ